MDNQTGAESRPQTILPATARVFSPASSAELHNSHLTVHENGDFTLRGVKQSQHDALRSSIIEGNVEAVRFLLINGADSNLQDESGYRPLHLATALRDKNITKLLLEYEAQPNVYTSSRSDYYSTFQLRSLGISTNMAPLHIAAKNDCIDVAEALIEAGADVEITTRLTFRTPLMLAVEAGSFKMAEFLLTNRADPNGNADASCCPLIVAIRDKRDDMVKVLCRYGCDMNRRDENGDPAIHTAAKDGSRDLVVLLLELYRKDSRQKAPLDLQGGSGRPAWWFAQRSGHLDIMALLKSAPEGQSMEPSKFPTDLSDDSTCVMGNIGIRKLRDDISKAQNHIYRIQNAGESKQWKERLRFVIRAAPGAHYQFEVIQPFLDGNENDEPFVAVSYCWELQCIDQKEAIFIRVPNISGIGATIRALRVRREILLRSMEYAYARGIQRVWIDQECIHQDDPEDKRMLVGAMHYLYRHATVTLAVLGEHIQSVEDIEAIKFIADCHKSTIHSNVKESTMMPASEHSRIVSSRIHRDRWFERAWTFQEAISAGSGNLAYLVGWNQNLDKGGDLWKQMISSLPQVFPKQFVPRQLILDGNTIWSMAFVSEPEYAMSAMSYAFMQRYTALTRSVTMRSSDIESNAPYNMSEFKNPENMKPSPHSPNHEQVHTAQHGIAIFALFQSFRGKNLSMNLDRPSILANLARYEFYLDMVTLVQDNPRISLTACILALSFANGDLSFLTEQRGLHAALHERPPETSWLPEESSLTSFYPISQSIVDGRSISPGSPCVVVQSKLVVKGISWRIATCEDLLPLQPAILRLIDYCKDYPLRARLVGVELLKAVLKQLFDAHKAELVGHIITLARQKNWESPEEFLNTMQQLKSWHCGGDWPPLPQRTRLQLDESSIETDLSTIQELEIDVSTDIVRSNNLAVLQDGEASGQIPDEWGDSLLRWIYKTIVRGLPFPIGTFDSSKVRDRGSKTAIFKLNILDLRSEATTMAFVPMADLDYNFKGEQFLNGPAVRGIWQVRKVEGMTNSTNDLIDAKQKLIRMGCQGVVSFQEQDVLSIIPDEEFEGVWSPLLCTDGTLEWDYRTKSGSMISLADCALYYFFS